MAVGALIIVAGLAISVVATSTATATTTPQVQGTDISNLTTVTWQNLPATMKFAGIEAIQGKTIVNTHYAAQATAATSAGLFVMPYVYADPGKIATGTTQWGYAWNVISGAPYARGGLMLPVALDMEKDPINFPNEPCYGLTPKAMVAWIGQFFAAAQKQTGAAPFLYTTAQWWAQCTNNATFSADPLWIANYDVASPAMPPGWPGYTIWQSSNTANISGIAGPGDLDLMQGAPPALVAKSGSGGSFQVQTLNGLAGQQVSYTATGLTANTSLTSAGKFTWTAATPVGAYAVTVTPASNSAALPATVPFTLKVHGAITVASPGNPSSTAGSPVLFRVGTSGPDQNAGFPSSLRATGLPPGASISSSGVISGWLSKAGTYKVTVRASDWIGGAGSVSFTWAVRAAADSGFTGPIRQAGGTARCLDDPASNTANGTGVDLSSCTGHANQSWTVVQDGTIRVLGKCLDVVGGSKSNGAKMQLWTCNPGDGAQQWQAGTDGELVNPQSGKCLEVPVASAANGTRPVLSKCANVATQHWQRPAANVYSGVPGRCLAVSGTAVVLAGCANTAAQHWTAQPDGTVRLGGKCLTETAATAGSGLLAGSCSGAAATAWKLSAAGPIGTELTGAAAGLCVTTPSPTPGAKLVLEPCAATPAATWHVE